jgi:hypothetical protein
MTEQCFTAALVDDHLPCHSEQSPLIQFFEKRRAAEMAAGRGPAPRRRQSDIPKALSRNGVIEIVLWE